MKHIFRTITLLFLISSSLFADETGSASIFSFFNGIPLEKNEVLIDGKYSYYTDQDGSVELILETGKHQIEIFAKDENGQNLGYTKKTIEIKEGRDTQLIATFNDNGLTPHVEIDTPLTGSKLLADNEDEKTGTIHGIVLTSDKNLPIANARVFVKGTAIDTKTDENGNFYVNVPANTKISISIVHSEYSAQTVNDLEVATDDTINTKVKLTPASMELEEFIVLAPQVQGSISSIVAEVKNSSAIASIIGAEQMKKQGDSTAADALKRVAGVTIIDGSSIYVRGLGDRYSATELNGLSLPSPSPIKRTVPLDMFPSSVIGSLQVQKTASADITGAFGGGYVNVRTKDKFNDDYVKLQVGLRAHSSIGDTAITAQGGSTDFLGVDDGYRTFNQSFTSSILPQVGQSQPTLTQDRAQMQEIISQRSYNHRTTAVPLGQDIGLELAKKIEFGDGHTLYVLAGYDYKVRNRNIDYNEYDYIISATGEQSENIDNKAVTNRFVNTVQHGGILNFGYTYNSLDLRFVKLYVLNTLNQTRYSQGTFGDNNSDERQTIYEFQERELDVNQFTGGFNYKFFLANRFDFGVEYATANEYVPNDVFYNYIRPTTSNADHQFLRNQSDLNFLHRTTDDTLSNFYIKNKIETPIFSDKDYLEVGFTSESKERQSRISRIRMQTRVSSAAPIDEIINLDAGQRFRLTSLPRESFDASLNRDAYYVKSLIKPSSKADITIGLRHINLKETVHQFGVTNGIVDIQDNTLTFTKTLPSTSFKYAFNASNQIKLAYSETFIYPDFREFAFTEFIHPVFLAKVVGNPNLVETDIKSYDLQYGHYFNSTDNITISAFYKHMDNPIEDVRTFTTSTLDRFSFENSSAADLAGLELSWYKNLGFLSDYADQLTFFGNYTYMYSAVTLTQEQKEMFVTQERGLQGLSPQVINLSLMYQDTTRSLNIAYNKMSERLMRVAIRNGNVILGLDDYEEPPHLLDFTWVENFRWDAMKTDVELTFKIKNILDAPTVWKQGDRTTLEFRTGSAYSLTLDMKI